MVNFGEYLLKNVESAWKDKYVRYETLKKVLSGGDEELGIDGNEETSRYRSAALSMSVPQPSATPQDLADNEELFFLLLEEDMARVRDFTGERIGEIQAEISAVELLIYGEYANREDEAKERLKAVAAEFLRLEKFVNLNYTGFDKIMKKHDKIYETPCRSHYLTRLASEPWARGNYSQIVVGLSQLWQKIRGDKVANEVKSAAQNFRRTTTKYWVQTKDVTAVKARVLMHLPVFLQESMNGESDAQLVNSVYLDNTAMELYRGRLNKTPGAIALRLRWYGTATPTENGKDGIVFVERKTHLEKWSGGLSVKERFSVPASEVRHLFDGTFDVDRRIAKMRKQGKSENEILSWKTLVEGVCQAIQSKQLVPTIRTQCYRTAFQVPFDQTVRISLDTNLCMITERTDDAIHIASTGIWFRSPKEKVPPNEITRFPHAILEVKIQVEEGQVTPEWVDDLTSSGLVAEVHKFSKFTHGCAVLMTDDVSAVPYWVDDPSLEHSILASNAEGLLRGARAFRDANNVYSHLLPFREGFKASEQQKAARLRVVGSAGDIESGADFLGYAPQGRNRCAAVGRACDHSRGGCGRDLCCGDEDISIGSYQKIEPKVMFANERTFLHWLDMAVELAACASVIFALCDEKHVSHVYALTALVPCLLFVIYAMHTYLWRGHRIRTRYVGRWDDVYGPTAVAVVWILAASIVFIDSFHRSRSARHHK